MRRHAIAFALAFAVVAGIARAQTPDGATPPGAQAPLPGGERTDPEKAPETEYLAEARAFYDSLDRKTGAVRVVGGKVILTVPDTHYFVGPADAKRILVDKWRNPPEAANGVEGMIFPRDGNPMLDGWGAIVEYSADGHVSDADAAKIDYAKLLADMQKDTRDANAERTKAGYPAVDLIGWAETPRYDAGAKKLYWAKTLQFAGENAQTLNYDIRILGRDGVLVISFITGMDQLEAIHAAAPAVMAMPAFQQGARYSDYKPGVDKKAAYGIAGLIAGGAALALAKKAGLIGLILAFGKKFIVLFGVAFAAIARFFGGMFGKKKSPD